MYIRENVLSCVSKATTATCQYSRAFQTGLSHADSAPAARRARVRPKQTIRRVSPRPTLVVLRTSCTFRLGLRAMPPFVHHFSASVPSRTLPRILANRGRHIRTHPTTHLRAHTKHTRTGTHSHAHTRTRRLGAAPCRRSARADHVHAAPLQARRRDPCSQAPCSEARCPPPPPPPPLAAPWACGMA